MVFLGVMVMDSPFSPHPPLPNPQLPMPERNVMPILNLRLMPIPKLGMDTITVLVDMADIADTVDTTDMDMVDTTAVDTADTTDGANREIQCKTLILKERKNNCHQTKLNQKTA